MWSSFECHFTFVCRLSTDLNLVLIIFNSIERIAVVIVSKISCVIHVCVVCRMIVRSIESPFIQIFIIHDGEEGT